ncbi:MAG: hypothetical protein ACYDG7_04380 [Thermoleophilia bacterium]
MRGAKLRSTKLPGAKFSLRNIFPPLNFRLRQISPCKIGTAPIWLECQ